MSKRDRPFLTFHVASDDDGRYLSSILRTRYQFSRGLIRRLKQEGCAYANGLSARMRQRVRAGDAISLHFPRDGGSTVVPEAIPLSIMYEDEDVLAVDKPPGLLVHPAGGEWRGTVANGVAAHLIARGEASRAGPVTRLDRQTSGILLFAKHPYAHHRLSQIMAQGQFIRQYAAVASGRVPGYQGVISAPIRRVQGKPSRREIGPGGQHALTHYEVIQHLPAGHTVLKLCLETGRTHQIRVHLDHIGHPLIGDRDYGGKGHDLLARQALHCVTIRFVHPRTEKNVTLHSPLPPDMAHLVRRLGGQTDSLPIA